MLTETGARSAPLREPDIAALRRRVLVARHQAAQGEASATANCQGALEEAHRTYVTDVEALLDDRRELLETIAPLRRVAVAAEAALAESRAGQQAKRATDLVRALELAGYAQRSDAAHASVERQRTGCRGTCSTFDPYVRQPSKVGIGSATAGRRVDGLSGLGGARAAAAARGARGGGAVAPAGRPGRCRAGPPWTEPSPQPRSALVRVEVVGVAPLTRAAVLDLAPEHEQAGELAGGEVVGLEAHEGHVVRPAEGRVAGCALGLIHGAGLDS